MQGRSRAADAGMSAFELPICIAYRPPRAVLALVFVIHAGALLCIWFAGLRAVLSWGLTVLVCANGVRLLRALWRERCLQHAILLQLDPRDQWTIRMHDAEWQPAYLLPGAFVHPLCQVLRFRTPAGVHAFILTRASAPGDVLRRLRVRLRHPLAI